MWPLLEWRCWRMLFAFSSFMMFRLFLFSLFLSFSPCASLSLSGSLLNKHISLCRTALRCRLPGGGEARCSGHSVLREETQRLLHTPEVCVCVCVCVSLCVSHASRHDNR